MDKTIDQKQLRFEIKVVEDLIKSKQKHGEDASFEESLLRAWQKYLPKPKKKATRPVSARRKGKRGRRPAKQQTPK